MCVSCILVKLSSFFSKFMIDIDLLYVCSLKMVLCIYEDTLDEKDVPPELREIGIRKGYRRQNLSFLSCFRSLFTLHNETFNVWTHLISFGFYVYYSLTQPLDLWLPENQSILCILITCCLFPLGSALAHLFMSMSPVIRHICFFIDYASISLYAFGAGTVNKIYALPKLWRGGLFEAHYLQAMFLNCVLTVVVACHTRFLPRTRSMTLLRLAAFSMPYLYGMLPCIYRVLYCGEDNSCEGASYYAKHFFDTIFTVSFYGGHIPEVFFPGHFDIFFHSHSLFHVIVVVGTFHHLQGILVDKAVRPTTDIANVSVSPLMLLLMLLLINIVTIFYFGIKMARREAKLNTSKSYSKYN